MSKCILTVLSLLLAACGMQASAASSACPGFYAAGQAPDIVNTKLTSKARELCSGAFVVMHSGVTRTPLWSAELITKEHVLPQRGMKRENMFHPDERLSPSERSELQDYMRSGYDRGHMTPSASAWTPELQHETFALSNMIPQNSNNNEHLHAYIETAVRNFAKKVGRLYVITGPLFRGAQISWLHNRVAIPTHGIRAKGKRRFKVTTDSKHDLPISPNLLNREFTVAEPDKVWVG